MKLAIFLLAVAFLITPPHSSAQVVETTVCEILMSPESFDGKIVKIKGAVVAGFEEFEVQGPNCNQPVDAIWLSYPEGTGGKAGPVAFVGLQPAKNFPAQGTNPNRAPIKLDKNKDFKNFDNLLATPAKVNNLCLGCGKFSVTATMVGRLDGVKGAGLQRDSAGKITGMSGFGNLNHYKARLVLRSVSEISSQEIDYTPRVSPADAGTPGSFTPGAPTADSIKRAAGAFGAQGEDNGVTVGFGGANEVPKNESAGGQGSSPDGVIYRTIYDNERLKGSAMTLAMTHTGNHIADLRSPQVEIATVIPFGAEFRAWQATLINAIASKVKTVELPGGYTVYDQNWSRDDLGRNSYNGISAFLKNWSGITNSPKN